MRHKLILSCRMVVLAFVIGCTSRFHGEHEDLSKIIPFNYNTPNVHVFSVKAATANGARRYEDTLGFLCTNKPDRLNSVMTETHWVFLVSPRNGIYVLNPNKNSNTSDGTLCSPDTLFMHPPRIEQYTILQICPYPFLQFPLCIGKKWGWDLDVGSMWCPSKTLSWSGIETFSSKYEVTDTPYLKLPFGKVTCYHIHATNDSKFGTSSAEFYYSYKYGFVKMDYHPLDSTEVIFDLLTTTNDPGLFKSVIPNYREGEEFVDLMKK